MIQAHEYSSWEVKADETSARLPVWLQNTSLSYSMPNMHRRRQYGTVGFQPNSLTVDTGLLGTEKLSPVRRAFRRRLRVPRRFSSLANEAKISQKH